MNLITLLKFCRVLRSQPWTNIVTCFVATLLTSDSAFELFTLIRFSKTTAIISITADIKDVFSFCIIFMI